MNGRIHTERKRKNTAVKQAPRASSIWFWDSNRNKLCTTNSHILGQCRGSNFRPCGWQKDNKRTHVVRLGSTSRFRTEFVGERESPLSQLFVKVICSCQI